MELLYSDEHLRCINYDQGENPIMEVVAIEEGGLWENSPLGNKLVFVLTGEISFSFGRFSNCQIGKNRILYLPTGYSLKCKALNKSKLFVMRVQGQTRFCDDYHFQDLEKETSNMLGYSKPMEEKPPTLEVNGIMEKYLEALLLYIGAGAKCKCFYLIKIKELFYIFRWFYPKETLVEFFQYALKGGSEFAGFIMDSWHKYKSVGELAEAMNYTVSGFEKRFKRVFGVSPYRWMNSQKAERIFHQVRTTDLTFKQISANFGFTSLTRFNDFCKANFGKPPGDIREKSRVGGNHE